MTDKDLGERLPGGQPGNSNRFQHGLRMTGTLPKDCQWLYRRLVTFRRCLEREVIAVHGELDIVHAATLQSVLRWEQVALLAQRWLRTCPDLSPDQKLAFIRQVATASDSRDRALARLKLQSESENDPWSVLTETRPAADRPGDDASGDSPAGCVEHGHGDGDKDSDGKGEDNE